MDVGCKSVKPPVRRRKVEATGNQSCSAGNYRVYLDLRKVLSLSSMIHLVGVIVMTLIEHFHYLHHFTTTTCTRILLVFVFSC